MNDDDDEQIAGAWDHMQGPGPKKAESPPTPSVEFENLSDHEQLVAALREQNDLLRRLAAPRAGQRFGDHWRAALAVAAGVFVAITLVWGVAQTNWGAQNFAVPVKFFVDADTAAKLGLDQLEGAKEESSISVSDADGHCPEGEVFGDRYDMDCPVE